MVVLSTSLERWYVHFNVEGKMLNNLMDVRSFSVIILRVTRRKTTELPVTVTQVARGPNTIISN